MGKAHRALALHVTDAHEGAPIDQPCSSFSITKSADWAAMFLVASQLQMLIMLLGHPLHTMGFLVPEPTFSSRFSLFCLSQH